jgi:hypothetical protein
VVDESKVLLTFVGEGVDIPGVGRVAQLNNAEGMVTLDSSKASSGRCTGWVVIRVVSDVVGISEALDNEHVRTEAGSISIRDIREDPFGNAGGVGTCGKGIGTADIKDCIEGTTTIWVSGVSHDGSMDHESSFIMSINDQFLHFWVRACSEDVGRIVFGGRLHCADGATAIRADTGLCPIG